MPEAHERFARLAWQACDIQSVRPDLTDAEAVAFLERNQRNLRDRLCELGWEIIDVLLDIDDKLPPKPEENNV